MLYLGSALLKELNEDDRSEMFIKLLAENERRLFAYVMTFVPRAADADDILQETKLSLWRSFEQFKSGTNFGAWARQTAFNRILDFRRRRGRESHRLIFSDSCVENLAVEFEHSAEQMDERIERLSDCVAKLPEAHRRILAFRYNESMSVVETAKRVDRSVAATYRVLSRIRLALRDCVLGVGGETNPQVEPL